ncbi:hypothetical protein CIC12_22085 [Burkholderia sp. SG-MS1]|uniref:PIG-L deacetylase family protein n=1 Tax=Paraburkholderia sp. SG-MS1 TaxID=2023741 RepID=UPI0014450DE3|nr:PIG-L family deacetylase [Paraburkholderia sp. SG-MS1]NKJ49370.1 hypothetical protein [Paraburkholderia sp. SG-MS1]
MNVDGPLLVVSPHLDDAVLSCGLLLASHPAATVCTIFTSAPEADMITDWDRASGFAGAFEAMRARRTEDVRALSALRASPIHLPFCDAQYLSSPSREALVAALRATFVEVKPATVLFPLGLFHSDHTMASDACLAALRSFKDPAAYAYEDLPYRNIPGVIQERLATMLEQRIKVSPADMADAGTHAPHQQLKQAALGRYASQLRAFGPEGRAALDSPERYWLFRAANESGSRRD